MNLEQAQTIINQFGGNGFKMMTGAKNFTFGPDGLTFRIGRNCHKINGVRVQLEPTDVYTVEFLRVSKNGIKVASRHEDVYCHDLIDLFEVQTGMFASIYGR